MNGIVTPQREAILRVCVHGPTGQRRELDAVVMQQAAARLLGIHDFRCFESQFPNKANSVRTVMEATVERCPSGRSGASRFNDLRQRN